MKASFIGFPSFFGKGINQMAQSKEFTNFKKKISSKVYGLTVWNQKYLHTISSFIDNPNTNKELYYANSDTYGLQHRRRVTLVQIIAILLKNTEAELKRIGTCTPKGIKNTSHKTLREEYCKMWECDISQSTWFEYINILKKVGYLSVNRIFIKNTSDQMISIPAHKSFTKKFTNLVNIVSFDYVVKSIAHCVKNMREKGLSNRWLEHVPTSKFFYVQFKKKTEKMVNNNLASIKNKLAEKINVNNNGYMPPVNDLEYFNLPF